jgi:protein-tyrosine phosphatase
MKNLTHLPYGLTGAIYRSPMPFGAFDIETTTLEEYQQAGINLIVMLTTPEEDLHRAGRDLEAFYLKEGYQVIRLPIVDFDVPEDNAGLDTTLKETIARAEKGENIAIHCYAGRGRTGMFAALLARRILKMEGVKAIEWTRQFFPAIETEDQALMVINDPTNTGQGDASV